MYRLQLFEFEDQTWFPAVIRDGMTDYLQFIANAFDFYQSVAPIVAKGLQASGGNTIIDLASGGGGGWAKLSDHLLDQFPNLKVVLSDRFPNKNALEKTVNENRSVFSIEHSAVDARNVPENLVGLRTQFLSFHHFKPKDAKRILQNAIDARQPIAIFEAQKRDIAHLVKVALSPIAILVATPFIRPFQWSRLLFTYLIPAIPVFTCWDGLVSVMRTYSQKELNDMISSLRDNQLFSWEIGESNSGSVTVSYLLGYPA